MAEERHSTTIDIKVDDREVVKLAQELERTFPVQLIETFNKALDRQSEALTKLIEMQTRLARTTQQQTRASTEATEKQTSLERTYQKVLRQNDQGGGGRGGGGGGFGPTFGGSFGGTFTANMMMRRGGQMAASPFGSPSGLGVTGMTAGVPVAGPIFQAAGQAITQLRQEFVQEQRAFAQSIGAAGIGRFTGQQMQSGLAFGLDPGQLATYTAQQAHATGMTGDRLAGAVAGGKGGRGGLLEMEKLGGVQAGGILRAAVTGKRGDIDEQRQFKLIKEAVGSGVIGGVRESDLGSFVQDLSSYVIQARTGGMAVEPEDILTLFRGLSGTGTSFVGAAGQKAAVQVSQGVQRLGLSGTLEDTLALMGSGFTGQKGGKSLPAALIEMQSDPAGVFGKMVEGMRGLGGGSGTEAGSMMIIAEQMGVFGQLSRQQRLDLFSGTKTFPEIEAEQGDPSSAAEELLKARRGVSGRVFSTLREEASFAAKRAHLGGGEEITEAVGKLRATDLAMAKTTLPLAATVMSASVDFINSAIKAAAAVLGIGAGALPASSPERQRDVTDVPAQLARTGQELSDVLNPEQGKAHRAAEVMKEAREFEAKVREEARTKGGEDAVGLETFFKGEKAGKKLEGQIEKGDVAVQGGGVKESIAIAASALQDAVAKWDLEIGPKEGELSGVKH